MADPSLAIQKTILSALDGALSCEVYDAVPQGAAYPYVTLDNTAIADESFLADDASRWFVYLTFWSRTKGQQQVLELMADAWSALHHRRLTLDTGRIAGIAVTRRQTQREPDNETFMGRMSLEILVSY